MKINAFSMLLGVVSVCLLCFAAGAEEGGLAIGATCNLVAPAVAFGIGLLAGALIKITGTTHSAYEDSEEFCGVE